MKYGSVTKTCPQCGRDLMPEPLVAETIDDLRIAWSCTRHGLVSLLDPMDIGR
jgi:hypothetical protein